MSAFEMDPRKEGVRQGFADGSCQTKLETAKLMCARNYPIAEICEMTGLPIESFPKKTVLILLIDNSVGTGAAVGNALALVKVLICAGVPLLRVYTFFCNGKRSDRSVCILCRFSIFGRRRIKMLFHFSGKMAYVAKARVFRNLVHR